MPRKTKDAENEVKIEKVKPTQKSKKIVSSDDKKISSSKKSSLSKKNSKNTNTSATAKKRANSGTMRTSFPTNDTAKPKTSSKTTKASATAKKKAKKSVKATDTTEYYDLPYRYNQTIVKILAQTPKKLFIYWDISDDDREKYIKEFGNDFFNNTIPVLIVHNDSMNFSFEVEINDFANSWYLDVNDSKCKYTIELGRKPKNNYHIPNNYFYITSSNEIESPNDHILFEKQSRTIYFRNVKNNSTYSKDVANLSFMKNMGKIYSIYDAYKELYSKIYSNEDIVNNFDLSNPSSGNPTSTFK